jgi:hypothetical protein
VFTFIKITQEELQVNRHPFKPRLFINLLNNIRLLNKKLSIIRWEINFENVVNIWASFNLISSFPGRKSISDILKMPYFYTSFVFRSHWFRDFCLSCLSRQLFIFWVLSSRDDFIYLFYLFCLSRRRSCYFLKIFPTAILNKRRGWLDQWRL